MLNLTYPSNTLSVVCKNISWWQRSKLCTCVELPSKKRSNCLGKNIEIYKSHYLLWPFTSENCINVSLPVVWCLAHFQWNISINLSIKTGSRWRYMDTNILWFITFILFSFFVCKKTHEDSFGKNIWFF